MLSQGRAVLPKSLVPVVPTGNRSLSWATLAVKVMVSEAALPKVVLPLTPKSVVMVAAPPEVNRPVPVVIARLVVVFKPKVPVPAKSKTALLADKETRASAKTVLAALSKVKLPVDVVIELA